MTLDILKVILPATLSFLIGIAATPFLSAFLYKHKMWKKKAGKIASTGEAAVIFSELHKDKEVGTPRMGGILIWFSAAAVALLFWVLAFFMPEGIFQKLEFISRSQTWIPFLALMIGAGVGLIDDLLEIRGSGGPKGGLSLSKRLFIVGIVGLLCSLWFYFKLDVHSIILPVFGELQLNSLFFTALFVMAVLVIYAGGVIDGLDGLAGGIFTIIFSAYGIIAYVQNQIDVAAFCAAIVGGLLAFLWFNIPPARFYMSETGSMALTLAVVIVAFMTDALAEGKGVSVLPVIAFPLIATAGSSLIQVLSKKIRGKKIFLVAPLHHHFEAIGWPAYKVVMRYWVIGVIFALIGIIIALAR